MDNFEDTIVNPKLYVQRDEIYRQYKPVVSNEENDQPNEEHGTLTFIIGAAVAVAFALIALLSQHHF